jgi:hypothetical protein
VVRCERIRRENDRRWCPLIGGDGGSESIAPGGGLRRRGEQMVTPRHGEGGGVAPFDRCHAVEGGLKNHAEASLQKQRGKKRGEAGAGVGVPRGEEEEGGLAA